MQIVRLEVAKKWPQWAVNGERWIDVDLTSQTLVAYEGARPVFATLVSSGRSGPGHETPVGVHRIWVKLAEDTMDDLPQIDQESNYAIEGVPWVQYFRGSEALHATFWHARFGDRHSHGASAHFGHRIVHRHKRSVWRHLRQRPHRPRDPGHMLGAGARPLCGARA